MKQHARYTRKTGKLLPVVVVLRTNKRRRRESVQRCEFVVINLPSYRVRRGTITPLKFGPSLRQLAGLQSDIANRGTLIVFK